MPGSATATPADSDTVMDDTDETPVASTSASATASTSTSVAGSTKRAGKKLTPAQLKKQKLEAAEAAGIDFNIGGSSLAAPAEGRYDDRKPGGIKNCGECGKKFVVTKVSLARCSLCLLEALC